MCEGCTAVQRSRRRRFEDALGLWDMFPPPSWILPSLPASVQEEHGRRKRTRLTAAVSIGKLPITAPHINTDDNSAQACGSSIKVTRRVCHAQGDTPVKVGHGEGDRVRNETNADDNINVKGKCLKEEEDDTKPSARREHPSSLLGATVRIKRGKFAGRCGRIIEIQNIRRVILHSAPGSAFDLDEVALLRCSTEERARSSDIATRYTDAIVRVQRPGWEHLGRVARVIIGEWYITDNPEIANAFQSHKFEVIKYANEVEKCESVDGSICATAAITKANAEDDVNAINGKENSPRGECQELLSAMKMKKRSFQEQDKELKSTLKPKAKVEKQCDVCIWENTEAKDTQTEVLVKAPSTEKMIEYAPSVNKGEGSTDVIEAPRASSSCQDESKEIDQDENVRDSLAEEIAIETQGVVTNNCYVDYVNARPCSVDVPAMENIELAVHLSSFYQFLFLANDFEQKEPQDNKEGSVLERSKNGVSAMSAKAFRSPLPQIQATAPYSTNLGISQDKGKEVSDNMLECMPVASGPNDKAQSKVLEELIRQKLVARQWAAAGVTAGTDVLMDEQYQPLRLVPLEEKIVHSTPGAHDEWEELSDQLETEFGEYFFLLDEGNLTVSLKG